MLEHNFKKCSIPVQNVKCFITKNTDADPRTQKIIHQQISRKIYATPKMPVCNTRFVQKKCADQFGVEGTAAVQGKYQPTPFKLDNNYFNQKKLEVEDIDVNALEYPMRSSTPTPSNDRTIMAGHLDPYLHDSDSLERNSESMEDPELDEFLQPYLNKCNRNHNISTKKTLEKDGGCKTEKPLPTDIGHTTEKQDYCTAWMSNENGVSTTNTDIPPSLYEPSILLSKSLLDVTSVSRNVSKPQPKLPKTGRGKISNPAFDNVTFM